MTSLIFITTLVFSFVFVFKTAEIQVSSFEIEGSNNDISELTLDYLNDYYKKNLIFISKKKIKSNLEELSGYISVKLVEKKLPNKLIVKVEERREVYSFKVNDKYMILDENLKVLAQKDKNVNNINGLSNVEIKANLSDYDVNLLTKGCDFKFYDEDINRGFTLLKSYVINRKENIKSIEVNVRSNGKINKYLLFTMTEGLTIQIDKAGEDLEDKLIKMFEYYDLLENKGDTVKRYVTKLNTGEIVVV